MAIKNFIEELEWRGMIHTIMPGAKEQLEKEMTTAYLGIDPTADSLHIGHLVGVMILKHFQMCGHRPIALVGGATGMIGDPSGKSQERNLLDEETLRRNQEAIKRQLAKLIDFDSDAPNAALMVNNYDWMKGIGFLDFIRDLRHDFSGITYPVMDRVPYTPPDTPTIALFTHGGILINALVALAGRTFQEVYADIPPYGSIIDLRI